MELKSLIHQTLGYCGYVTLHLPPFRRIWRWTRLTIGPLASNIEYVSRCLDLFQKVAVVGQLSCQLHRNFPEEKEEKAEANLLESLQPKLRCNALLPVSDFTCTPRDSAMESVFHTNQQKGLLCVLRVAPLLLLLLLNAATSAEEKNSQCHNYAGGHVYPGEAFRVPVSDHSLHLSKAKSEFYCHESICKAFK